jgi:hypothetical protein
MKNKILLGTIAFVAILAVIGILAVSFTMTPAIATNQTNATEFINITCTTAIMLNDSEINGGTGGVLQTCIDYYSNQSAAVVETKNATSSCWSGPNTQDYIRLLNKGNNLIRIDLNLIEDAGFIGQQGGAQFGYINNTVAIEVVNGNVFGSPSNDVNPACLNNTAFNWTNIQKNVPVTICGSMDWEITANEIFLFKQWFIQPKTAPGGYNFTETISATQTQCGGPDPAYSPPWGNDSFMYFGAGTNSVNVASPVVGMEAVPPIPRVIINVPSSQVSSVDYLATPAAGNIIALGVANNFYDNAGSTTVFTITPTSSSGTRTTSSGPTPGPTYANEQVAFSGDGSVMYMVMPGTTPVGNTYRGTLSGSNYALAAGPNLGTLLSETLTSVNGITNIGNFDPTTPNAGFYAFMYVASGVRKLAVIRADVTGLAAVVGTPITISGSQQLPLTPYTAVKDIAYDSDANALFALDVTTNTILRFPLGRDGNLITSFGSPTFVTHITAVVGGVAVKQTGTTPTLNFPNAY